MNNKIIVCGGNGAGKSTLGKALAVRLGYKFLDIEDYYFEKSSSNYIYDNPRTVEQVKSMLFADLNKYDNFVLAAVKGNYSNEISNLFTHAIFISVAKDVRIKRVIERSYIKFGNRVLPNGDLYKKENEFVEMVKKRSDDDILLWLNTLSIPTIKIDGTKPIEDNVYIIQRELFR